MDQISQSILAILFASGEPIELGKIASALSIHTDECLLMMELLIANLDEQDGAFMVQKLGGRYQLTTRQRFTPVIRAALEQKRHNPLSQASLEILAIIAYNQPVTKAFIEQVRGVDCSSALGGLVEKDLCEEAGRLELPGRPIAYRVTDNFLRAFGLSSLDELPELKVGAQEVEDERQLSLL